MPPIVLEKNKSLVSFQPKDNFVYLKLNVQGGFNEKRG